MQMDHGQRYEEQALLARTRSFSGSSSEESYSVDFELDALEKANATSLSSTARPKWWPIRPRRQRHDSKVVKPAHLHFHRPRRRRYLCFRLCRVFSHVPYILLSFILICGLFFPSYSNPPQRYADLRNRVESSGVGGTANLNNEKIFIAASLYDKEGGLLSGEWGQSVRRLVDILGHDNVFVSIYEDDPDVKSKEAMREFHDSLPCESSVVHEHLDLAHLSRVTMEDGSQRLKRIAFLAEVRNRALRPLDDVGTKAYHTRWDKLLYLNDIAFDPIDAANLLFNTNTDEVTGRTNYRAACAVDFINPFKFYDTFATRDLEGYDMGVPFYPWFTTAGLGTSRQDVLNQTDAVRVKSCWGGMVAFEAKWFQSTLYDVVGGDLVVPTKSTMDITNVAIGGDILEPTPSRGAQEPDVYDDFRDQPTLDADAQISDSFAPAKKDMRATSSDSPSIPPLRFRAETAMYWDASECCLIHADLAHRPLSGAVGPAIGTTNGEPGIYMNPYVRVAYSRSVLNWLPFTRRFERLYPFVHNIINFIGRRPGVNKRRLQQPGDKVLERVWRWDPESLAALRNRTVGELAGGLQGSFHDVRRKARPGQFCGSRKLLYLKDHHDDGESPWGSAKVPTVDG